MEDDIYEKFCSWGLLGVVMMSMAILYVADGYWIDSKLTLRILICITGCVTLSFLIIIGMWLGGAI